VFAIAGGSPRHNALAVAAASQLRAALRARGCTTLSSDQRIAFPPGQRYVYPDVTVVCGALTVQDGTSDVVVNPKVLVEILSKTTEEYDRGPKWTGYQTIGSLTDYVLISQSEVRVEHYRRNRDGSWTYRTAGPGETLSLDGGAELDVDAVYAGTFELKSD
jgi:Uma2 family endonuclease